MPIVQGRGWEQQARSSFIRAVAAPVERSSAKTPREVSARSGGTGRRRQLLEQEELRADARRLAGTLWFGLFVWWGFFGLDAIVVSVFHVGSLAFFLVLRVVGAALDVVSIAMLRRDPPPILRTRSAIDLFLYVSLITLIALMCLRFRGIESPYTPGIALVLAHRMFTSSEPWKRGVWMNGIPAATYPAVMLCGAGIDPAIAHQFRDTRSLALFAIGLSFIFGTAIVSTACGHIVWSLRREVLEARSAGRYKLQYRIGSGAVGEVWLAHDAGLKRDVAVKILRSDLADDVAVSRFEREAQATSGLTHPNTVKVFDFGVTEDGRWYYAMELLSGETVSSRVQRDGPMPPASAIHVAVQAAQALGEAHEQGIVHRDVKPSNVFLASIGGERSFVKVLDFGVARVLHDSGETTLTTTGAIIGTPAYISPEAVIGDVVDARADVYGVGASLYFMLTGRPPFDAGDGTIGLLMAHVNARPVPPSARLGSALPADLEVVVMRCLKKDPAERYEDGAALSAALLACRPA